jgi:hypothetical protein
MDVSPTSTSNKRTRSKAAQTASSAANAPRKRLTTVRKNTQDAASTASISELQTGARDLHGVIERAAYELAAQRSFMPGHEMDDWLEAERRVKATLG